MRNLVQEVIGTFRWIFATEKMQRHTLWLTVIVAVGAAVRSYFLAQPMRYDEAFTFLNFVNRGVVHLFDYPVPNNHVLHTLLVWMSVGVFGAQPLTIRLPAFVAGLLNIPLTFALAKTLNAKTTAGFMAASMMAVFPYLILYDTMVRGYSLLVLICLCLVVTGLRIINNPSSRLSVMVALQAALGLFDMPSFLFTIAGVILWVALALLGRGHRAIWILTRILVPWAITMAVITVILYTPVIIASNGISSIVANQFVQGEPLHQFLSSLPAHVALTIRNFCRSIPTPFLVVLAFLLICGIYSTIRERRWTMLLLLPACLVGAAVVLLAKHAIPYPRTWIYFLPLLFVYIDGGLSCIPRLSASHIKMGLLAFAICSAVILINHDTISSYSDTGHFPEAPVLVDILAEEMTVQDSLIVKCAADEPMHFYMWYKNVPVHRHAPAAHLTKREFVVVKTSRQSVREMTQKRVRKLVSFGDAELYVTDMGNGAEASQREDALDEE